MFPVKAVYLLAQHPMPSLGARDAGSPATFLPPLLSWVLNLTCPQSPNILQHHPFSFKNSLHCKFCFLGSRCSPSWNGSAHLDHIQPWSGPIRISTAGLCSLETQAVILSVGFDGMQEVFLGAASCTSVLPRKNYGCDQFLLNYIWKVDKINEKTIFLNIIN